MRCLERDKRWVLVSLFEESEQVRDEEGRLTGQHKAVRSRQIPVLASVSAAKGSVENAGFGQNLDYDRTVIIDDPKFEISEAAVLWMDVDVYGALVNGGYFERYSLYESGEDADGGDFEDYESGDEIDGGEFEYPVFSDKPYDHVIKKIARSANYTALAVKHVEVSR